MNGVSMMIGVTMAFVIAFAPAPLERADQSSKGRWKQAQRQRCRAMGTQRSERYEAFLRLRGTVYEFLAVASRLLSAKLELSGSPDQRRATWADYLEWVVEAEKLTRARYEAGRDD